MEPAMKASEVFTNYFAKLTNVLGHDMDSLLPSLVTERVVTVDNKVVMEKTVSPSEKAGKLLGMISGPLEAGNQSSFEKLLQIMVNAGTDSTRDMALAILKEIGIAPKIAPKITPKESTPTVPPSSTSASVKPRLLDLMNLVTPYITDKWEKICIQLMGDEHHVLSAIRRDYRESEDSCQAMFTQWLDLCPNASWNDLIAALRAGSVRKNALAEELVTHVASLSSTSVIAQPKSATPTQQAGSRGAEQMVGVTQSEEEVHQPVQTSSYGGSMSGSGSQNVPQAAVTNGCGKGTVQEAVFIDLKRAVCRVHAPQVIGTGFLGYAKHGDGYITVLVTSNHVIPDLEDAKGSRIVFEHLLTDRRLTLKGFEVVTGRFWFSPRNKLDYTIVELNEDKLQFDGKPLDVDPIYITRPADIKSSDRIYVIQYPRREYMEFSISDCIVKGDLLSTTEKGSSGSPILKEVDGELKIVALQRGPSNMDHNQLLNCGSLIEAIIKDYNTKA